MGRARAAPAGPPPPAGLPWPVKRGRGVSWLVDAVPVPTVSDIVDSVAGGGGLAVWRARVVAGYAVDHWDELNQATPEDRYAALVAAQPEGRSTAAREREVRQLLADVWAGARAGPDAVGRDIRGDWLAVCAWLDGHQVEPIAWQRRVYEPRPTRRYVGEVDLIARIDGGPTLLVAVEVRDKVYPTDMRLRLAALRYAPQLLSADGREVVDWPAVTDCAVLHVRPEGVSLLPMKAGPRERARFRGALPLHAWRQSVARESK